MARSHRGHRALLPLALFIVAAACDRPQSTAEEPPGPGSEILERITRPGDGGEVHLVRLVQRGDSYSFDPAELTIAPGEVVRFVMTGSQPESIAFDPATAAPEIAQFIQAHRLDRGVLLTDPGQAYDVSFRDAPLGSYPFQSVPHGGSGMRGTIVVSS